MQFLIRNHCNTVIVCNPGIFICIKKNLEYRVCTKTVFGIKVCTGKAKSFFRIKIKDMAYSASGTNPVIRIFILRNLKYYVSRNSISRCKVRDDFFILHKENTTAVCTNPDNAVCIFINTHYIFRFKTICLLKINKSSILVDNGQAGCCSDIIFAGFCFYSYTNFISYKAFVCRPGFNCFSIIKNLSRFCVTAYKNFVIRSNFYVSDS